MVFAAGLLCGIPAIHLFGISYPLWALSLWGFVMAIVGIAIGSVLRQQLLINERLPFPSGVATAAVIRALHSSRHAARRAYTLVTSGLISAVMASASVIN